MLSTQATETTKASPMQLGALTELMAPMCTGDPSTTTLTTPFITTTLPTPVLTIGSGENICTGGINCTVITDQRGATIVSPLLLGLTGTIGQIWALVYLHHGTRRQNQRTIFYLLLCILIWTDFFGKILTTPPAVISYSYKTWIGGKPMCDFHGLCMVFICLLTHFTVSAMAIERYLGICHGYFYSRNVTSSRCKMLFCGIWMFCLVFSVLPLLHVGKFYLQYPGTWCFTNFHLCTDTSILEKIFTTTVGVLNATNLINVVVCNVMVVGSLLKMRITPHKAFQQGQQNRNRKKNEQELQMVIVLIVITCVFVISWAPFDFILITNQAWGPHGNQDHFQELIAIRLCSINQIVDPFVYIISRVMFRSRFWKCCHRAIMGRGWSRRGEGIAHFPISSFLQSRKFSRAQSPPKDEVAAIREEHTEDGASCPPKERTTRIPSLQKSHYSDSGTGSCSGIDSPLVEKHDEQPFSSDTFPSIKRTVLERSLAKSLSVAIPIPLFKSEQYRVAERGKESVDGHPREVFYLVDGARKLNGRRVSTPDIKGTSESLSEGHPQEISFITVSGLEDSGVFRSNSWGCHISKPQPPQCRTKSTQTLACIIYKNSECETLSIETLKVSCDIHSLAPNANTTQETDLLQPAGVNNMPDNLKILLPLSNSQRCVSLPKDISLNSMDITPTEPSIPEKQPQENYFVTRSYSDANKRKKTE